MDDRREWLLSQIPPPYPSTFIREIDIKIKGERHIVARGGAGGHGNIHFTAQDIKGKKKKKKIKKKQIFI